MSARTELVAYGCFMWNMTGSLGRVGEAEVTLPEMGR